MFIFALLGPLLGSSLRYKELFGSNVVQCYFVTGAQLFISALTICNRFTKNFRKCLRYCTVTRCRCTSYEKLAYALSNLPISKLLFTRFNCLTEYFIKLKCLNFQNDRIHTTLSLLFRMSQFLLQSLVIFHRI